MIQLKKKKDFAFVYFIFFKALVQIAVLYHPNWGGSGTHQKL